MNKPFRLRARMFSYLGPLAYRQGISLRVTTSDCLLQLGGRAYMLVGV